MSKQEEKRCVFCFYARMRTDICGIYCTGGFRKPSGECEHFKPYEKIDREATEHDSQRA